LHIRFRSSSPRWWRYVPSEIIGPASVVAFRSQMYPRPDAHHTHFPQEGMNEDAT